MTDEEAVAAALALVREADQVNAALAAAKDDLRFRAMRLLRGATGTVTLACAEGSVSVNFPNPRLKVQSTPEALREHLGSRYHDLFRERVTVSTVPNFRELAQSEQMAAVRETLNAAVVEMDETPRVSFHPVSNKEA